jgi:hypothetical protein
LGAPGRAGLARCAGCGRQPARWSLDAVPGSSEW